MTKDVLVSIKGLQFDTFQEDMEIETVTMAEYYQRNGSHYVLYEEAGEGFEESTRNMMKFKANKVELTKKGLINVQMIFEVGKKNMSNYATPFGDILVGIDTDKITIDETDDEIRMRVEYALELNYEHQADCRIDVKIKAKK